MAEAFYNEAQRRWLAENPPGATPTLMEALLAVAEVARERVAESYEVNADAVVGLDENAARVAAAVIDEVDDAEWAAAVQREIGQHISGRPFSSVVTYWASFISQQ